MISKFISWQCKNCGYWQAKEIRFDGDIINKLKKTNLQCKRCRKNILLKSEKNYGLNTNCNFFDTSKQCSLDVQSKNLYK
jgi:hypothetical protein